MENFLREHGLLAIFLGAVVERDAVCILTGILAHLQVFPLVPGILAALGGAFGADALLYFLGRRHSAWIRKFRLYNHAKRQLDRLNRRFGAGAVIISQFLYGFRSATMIFFGLREMPLKTFLLLDLAGCLFLVTLLVSLGYFLSDAAERFLGKFKAIEGWLLAGLGVSIILTWLGARLFRKWFAGSDT